jgi:cytidylate kinase
MAARRIAVTGGPGGGKTTVWRELSQRYASELVAVPEVATLMFQHVFPSVENAHERSAVQRSIFEVQRNLEAVYEGRLLDGQYLLCDRGTPDGAGYWPDGYEGFFEAMATRWDDELARYDTVLFLETAAAGGLSIAEGNPVRNEDRETALAIDRRLHDVWRKHPAFHHVPHELDFSRKVARACELFARALGRSA